MCCISKRIFENNSYYISICIQTFKRGFARFGFYNNFTVRYARRCKVLNVCNDRGLTRWGARRTRYTPAIWLISGNVRLNEWTGGDRCGSGTLAEYSNGSVSSTYCTRHARDIMTGVKTLKTASESERQIAADNCCLHDGNNYTRATTTTTTRMFTTVFEQTGADIIFHSRAKTANSQ